MAVAKEPKAPLRLTVASAAEQLDVGPETVRALIRDGVLTGLAPYGRGHGKRLYVNPREVEAFARGGVDAVKQYRKQHRIPEPKGK